MYIMMYILTSIQKRMDTKNTFTISEARRRIFEIAEKVQVPNTYVTLTESGKPKVVILSSEEFDSWMETLEVTKDFPELKKDIKQAKKEVKKKAIITLDAYYGKAPRSLKSKSTYAVYRCTSKKSSKRSR